MSCKIKNPSGTDLSSLGPHVQGMYDYFDQKLGFQKPPVMVFDSDPSNQSKVLGKTAYYDPQSLEVHVFVDGRHPKDMLRSIAHELIHHQQNLEGRLNVGGYMGEGYYLKNEEMKKLEQEAMLEGNALMREYEDNLKLEEKDKMSLKEWKNNELNKQLLKKFGILKEEKKPDADGDGVPDWADKKPGEDDHAEDKKEEVNEEAGCPKCEGECKCEEMNEEQLDEYGSLEDYEREYREREAYAAMNPEEKAAHDAKLAADREQREKALEKPELSYKEKEAAAQRKRGQRTMAQASIPRQFRENKVEKGIQETYPDTTIAKEKRRPDVIKSPKDSPFKKRVKAAQDVKKEGLQEALKKIAKAKNIILKSSKKRIR